MRTIFDFNPAEEQNPAGTRIPVVPCRLKFFGICPNVDSMIFGPVQNAVYNIHQRLRAWKLDRSKFPLLISLAVAFEGAAGVAPHFWLLDDIGRGDTQVLTPALVGEAAAAGGDRFGLDALIIGGKQIVPCSTSQVVIKGLLEECAHRTGAALNSFRFLELFVFSFARDPREPLAPQVANRFAAVKGEALRTEVKLPLFCKLKRGVEQPRGRCLSA